MAEQSKAEGMEEKAKEIFAPIGQKEDKGNKEIKVIAKKPKKASLFVRVKEGQTGYYGHVRRKEGTEFDLNAEEDFSPIWMERITTMKEGD